MRGALLAMLVALAGAPARAQEPLEPRPEHLYVNTGILVGSTRLTALGGAYVSIAEGATAFSSNLAALAHRSPELDRDWNVDFSLSYVDVPLGNPAARDLDNDGARDDWAQSRQAIAGLLLQYKNYGVGAYLHGVTLAYCPRQPCLTEDMVRLTLTRSTLAGAVALGEDELIAALGLYSVGGTFSYGADSWEYSGSAWELGLLYRPRWKPYRLGASVRPGVVAWYHGQGEPPQIPGATLFAGLVAPPLLSLGMSMKLGPGAESYNRLSPAARRQGVEEGGWHRTQPADRSEGLEGRWLVTAQLDVISPVQGAVPIRASTFGEVTPVGTATYLMPRVGVEHETFINRLRSRLGTFIEPSPFPDRLPRPHLTGGLEVRLFRYIEDWGLSASFDLAQRYSEVGFSIGLWR